MKATLVGGLISNSALIMGVCCAVAGLVYRRPRFRREEAGHHSVLLMLTVAAILFPSLGAFVPCPGPGCADLGGSVMTISVGISVVLLLAYLAYVAFGIFGWEALGHGEREGRDTRVLKETHQPEERAQRAWSPGLSLAVLAGATALLVPVTNILTDSVTPVTATLGWTEVFVGMVIVANAGNVAEGYAAIRLAKSRPGIPSTPRGDTGLDLALGIASASSIQIATFVAPLVVLYSLHTAHPMSLVFSPVEIGILALLAVIFTFIAQDGESNWLEGAQLLALYAMAAIVFYALPVAAFGS